MSEISRKSTRVSIICIQFTSFENVCLKKTLAFKEPYSIDSVEKIIQRYFPPTKKMHFLYFEENRTLMNVICKLID